MTNTLILCAIIVLIFVLIALRRRRKIASAPATIEVEQLLSDQTVRLAFEQHHLPIGFINATGRWLDVNRALQAELGYSREELGRLPLRLLTHPDDRKTEARLLTDLRAGRRAHYSMRKRVRRKQGDYRTYLVEMSRAGTASFQCTLDPREHEETTLGQIARISDKVEGTAIIQYDEAGSITSWNRGAELLFGFSEVDMLGRSWSSLHSDQGRAVGMLSAAAQNRSETASSFRIRKDSSPIEIMSSIVADLRMSETAGFLEICHPVAPAVVETAIAADPEELEMLRKANDALRGEISRVRRESMELRSQLTELDAGVAERDAQQRTIDELNARIAELLLASQSLAAERESLRAENDDLTRKLRILARGVKRMATARLLEGRAAQEETGLESSRGEAPQGDSAVTIREDEPAAPHESAPAMAVYGSRSRVYHRQGCSSLRNGTGDREFVSPSAADAAGFRPCKRCG